MRERASNDSAPIYRTGRDQQSLSFHYKYFSQTNLFSPVSLIERPNRAKAFETVTMGARRHRQKRGTWIEISTDSWEIKNDACTLIISSTMWDPVLGASLITRYYRRCDVWKRWAPSFFAGAALCVLYRMWKGSLGVERETLTYAHTRTHTHARTDPPSPFTPIRRKDRATLIGFPRGRRASSAPRSLLSTPSSSRREPSN